MVHDEARRSRWIPWAFVAFFAVVLAVNGVMIFFAFSTWTGLEAESAYRHGLEYNRALERARAQEALGWQVDLAFEQGLPKDRGILTLNLEDANGNLIQNALVRARLARPTHEGHDFEVEVLHTWGGTYRREITFPLRGLWDIEVDVEAPSGTYRLEERVFLAP